MFKLFKDANQRQWIQWVIKFTGWSSFLILISSVVMSFIGYVVSPQLIIANIVFSIAFFITYTFQQHMTVYVIKRVFGAFITLLVIATITFTLLRLLPGGPFDQDKALPPEVIANIEAKYHLDKPVLVQYWHYLSGIAQGDLGDSYKYIGRSVTDIISETLPNTLQLGIYALLICYLFGIPAGVFAASKHNSWADNTIMTIAISGVTLPSFLVAAILILIFSVQLNWLPPALWDGPEYYIMPMLVLGIRPAAIIARLTRASVLEVINSDYIRTARSKGLPERVILFKHVLKNSLIPVLTFSGPLVSGVLTGSFITELIFAVPGMGKHLIQSVTNRDYPLILGLTLLFSAVLVLTNLLVDLLYSFFDPRIKLS